MNQVPSIGRIVQFRLPDTEMGGVRWRAAVIVNVFGTAVNLQVFLDRYNDRDVPFAQEFPSSRHEGDDVGDWRWPPFVAPKADAPKDAAPPPLPAPVPPSAIAPLAAEDIIRIECPEHGTKSIGQVAFERYNEARGGLTYDGKPVPGWDVIPQGIRDGWEHAAHRLGEILITMSLLDGIACVRLHGFVVCNPAHGITITPALARQPGVYELVERALAGETVTLTAPDETVEITPKAARSSGWGLRAEDLPAMEAAGLATPPVVESPVTP
jgi:hypothetical protein